MELVEVLVDHLFVHAPHSISGTAFRVPNDQVWSSGFDASPVVIPWKVVLEHCFQVHLLGQKSNLDKELSIGDGEAGLSCGDHFINYSIFNIFRDASLPAGLHTKLALAIHVVF